MFVATGDEEEDARVAASARRRSIPVNVVDRPGLSSFVVPAIVDRSPVVIGISTGGAAPVLARLIRARLEAAIPPAFGRLAALSASFRAGVRARLPNPIRRRRFWERVVEGPIAGLVYAGRIDAAKAAMVRALESENPDEDVIRGEVYLVGAGPGDPDLLTLRALRLMQQADVVVYDRLVSQGVLNLTRKDAQRIYAGKERGRHAMRQAHVNSLLARLAKDGKRVLRLKGGDPFIFGRGGEEIETLAAQGIPFQVGPGVTAASGCAGYAGIPLTHRDYAQSCVFVAGQLRDGTVDLDWDRLVTPRQTIVVYMGLTALRTICRELTRHGLAPDTPAALVEHGTTDTQRVHVGTVDTLPARVRRAQPRAPTLLIVGDVVRLRQQLGWFEAGGMQGSGFSSGFGPSPAPDARASA